jgi:hypothetical protein
MQRNAILLDADAGDLQALRNCWYDGIASDIIPHVPEWP